MNQGKKDEKVIFVNKNQIRVTEDELTGNQILQKAGISQEYDLFLVRGQESQKIEPDEIVNIKNGLRFRVIIKVVPFG